MRSKVPLSSKSPVATDSAPPDGKLGWYRGEGAIPCPKENVYRAVELCWHGKIEIAVAIKITNRGARYARKRRKAAGVGIDCGEGAVAAVDERGDGIAASLGDFDIKCRVAAIKIPNLDDVDVTATGIANRCGEVQARPGLFGTE